MSTKIEWTDVTWNPVLGCTRVSPGCEHCYAETFASRGLRPEHAGLTVSGPKGPRWTGEVRCLPERLEIPLHWSKPRKVFVCSMSDLFHEKVPFEFIDRVFAIMALCPQHTFQVLTKRPDRMREYFQREECSWGWMEGEEILAAEHLVDGFDDWKTARDLRRTRQCEEGINNIRAIIRGEELALPNIYIGVSVENRAALKRIDILRETPAALRFLSLEPLLEDLGTLDLRGIHWIIVGGESGPGARPMEEDWVRSIRDQCVAAGVPLFYKQKVESGKKISLPMLDGRQWAEMPA